MKTTPDRFLLPALITATMAFADASNDAQAQTVYQWNGTTNTNWPTGTNWQGGTIGTTGGTSNSRLNVYNGAGSTLTYTATQGTTVYESSGRGLVISNATNAVTGSMEITGGSFSTLGSTSSDIIGNAATGILTISGGSFIGAGASAGGTILGLNSGNWVSTLNVSGTGNATFTRLQMSAGNTTVNLNGGTLTANEIVDVDNSGVTGNSNTTFNFNGGTLKAGTGAATAFMTGLTNVYVQSGGAKIDSNGKAITIGQALLAGSPSGGLTLDDTAVTKGTLTLTSTNTYSGTTTVSQGTLLVNNSSGSGTGSGTVSVSSGATLGGTGTISGNTTVSGTLNAGNGGSSKETLAFGGTLGLSGATIFDIGGTGRGTGYDGIDITGALTNGGTLSLNFTDTFTAGSYTFDLFSFGSQSGSFSSVALTGSYAGSLINNGSGVWNYSSGGNSWTFTQSTGDLSFTAVPELSNVLIGGLLGAGLLRRRRKG